MVLRALISIGRFDCIQTDQLERSDIKWFKPLERNPAQVIISHASQARIRLRAGSTLGVQTKV